MALGWGSLKHMNDVMKHNRELLGRKKSVREIYKEKIKRRGTTYDNESLDAVQLRVTERLWRDKKKEIGVRVGAALILTLFISLVAWLFFNVDFVWEKADKYADKSILFSTVIYKQANGLDLKTDYFVHGPRAAETFLKNGLKHQNSDSYYETGEKFRSAIYFYDSLVTEVYFYRTGDTIQNFPSVNGGQVQQIRLTDKSGNKTIEFDFYDGKIIQGTYKETER